MTQTSDQFCQSLEELLSRASSLGFVAVDINSGQLHRRVGGYPGQDHRMPACCEVMYKHMQPGDEIVSQPESGKGASVVVRYKLPR